MTDKELMQMALDALLCLLPDETDDNHDGYDARDVRNWRCVVEALRARLAQPAYRRGGRLLCLETDEHCVIYVSGTDRQWIKFPDSHIGVYTNEQVAQMFELMPTEQT